jgi:hypothetical protein
VLPVVPELLRAVRRCAASPHRRSWSARAGSRPG